MKAADKAGEDIATGDGEALGVAWLRFRIFGGVSPSSDVNVGSRSSDRLPYDCSWADSMREGVIDVLASRGRSGGVVEAYGD